MTWQQKMPPTMLGADVSHGCQWQHDFVIEWHRFPKGVPTWSRRQTSPWELHALQGTRNPIEVARDEWGGLP